MTDDSRSGLRGDPVGEDGHQDRTRATQSSVVSLPSLPETWRAKAEIAKAASRAANHAGNTEMDAYRDGQYEALKACAYDLSSALSVQPDLRPWVQHKRDCPAAPANHERFTFNSKPHRICDCGLDAALAPPVQIAPCEES